MSITNQELVNLVVQTKLEKLREQIAGLRAEIDETNRALLDEGARLLEKLNEEARAAVDPKWVEALEYLAQTCTFSEETASIRVQLSWENPLIVMRSRDPYWRVELNAKAEGFKPLPELVAYVFVETKSRKGPSSVMLRCGDMGGYLYRKFKPSDAAREAWAELYRKDQELTERQEQLNRLEEQLADSANVERRALAALTKRSISQSPELQAEIQQVIADVLSDTKLLSV